MLTVVTPEKAREIILSSVNRSGKTAFVPLWQAQGKAAAEDIVSPENLPAFSRSSVDGLAVRASDTYGCSEAIPAMLACGGKIHMGEEKIRSISAGECMEIPTGGRLPEGADAAVMVEYTEDAGDEFRYVLRPAAPFENVVRAGDDCKTGQTVITAGTVLSARHITVLAALGIAEVKVAAPLRAGIISTGDELVDFEKKPKGAEIRNINSVMLYSELKALGCEAISYTIIEDREEALFAAVQNALSECDIILISGGSSVGERDNTRRVLSKLGEICFHGIAVKPGKPTMVAVCGGKPVFGLPGHPAAAFFAYTLFVKPAVCKMLEKNENQRSVKAVLSQNIPSNHGREEIVAVMLNEKTAVPLPAKSGMVNFLAKANGYITVPRDAEGILKGAEVEVKLF